jgi:hypothetical protein
MTARRRLGVGVALLLLTSACAAESPDPATAAAEAICGAIDAEPDDVAAFEEYERAFARERRAGLDEDELTAALEANCGRQVNAIAAAVQASVEKVPEDNVEGVPEPEPDSDPVDLRTVTWSQQQWITTCVVDDDLEVPDEPQGVELATADEGSFERFGWFHAHPQTPVPRFEVDLDNPKFIDVTGDGIDEAVFEAACVPGNRVHPVIVVWTVGDESLEQLPEVLLWNGTDLELIEFEAHGGALRVMTGETAPGSSPTDGYPIKVTTDWNYDERDWNYQELSRQDTRPPPEPPSASPTGCENPNASAQDAALCLVSAVMVGDYETAATAATQAAINEVAEMSEWVELERWEFNGCSETCWFGLPSEDPQFHGMAVEMWPGTRDGGVIIESVDAYG